ncbi:hypothetical protein [Xenorhabdus hominickii]|uniref:Cytochrome P450 n=1 Tax=Xenorhabdus hominickii TaxID=351679 RepID=A0A2G0Q6P7_XENHO|nr:hypothetical protein [Xenorhabdus hominickii]AOM39353.1 hypothetical protein A9255_01240 [Xenorhabdus hominickii]PHM54892.1 hypothetical protein Xhom_02858 [Xenorhabdus hominickii]
MKECHMGYQDFHKIKSIFSDKSFTVRPKSEPVPKEIENSCAGDIFSALVRMRDGCEHERLKVAVMQALNHFTEQEIYQTTLIVAKILYRDKKIHSAESLTTFNYALPICVIGYFLGIPQNKWENLVTNAREFFKCIIYNGDRNNITNSILASKYLYTQLNNSSGILLNKLTKTCLVQGIDDKHIVISNAIGFFFQVSDGTTGLLGKLLIRYGKSKEKNGVKFLDEILSNDPPINNTRRFTIENGNNPIEKLMTLTLKANEGTLPFGYGNHCCPGEIWGKTIALSAFDFLISQPIPDLFISCYQWKNSPNTSVPEFITC